MFFQSNIEKRVMGAVRQAIRSAEKAHDEQVLSAKAKHQEELAKLEASHENDLIDIADSAVRTVFKNIKNLSN